MKFSPILAIVMALFFLSLPACNMYGEQHPKVVVTSPRAKNVTITRQYACQIHSQRRITIRASERGFLDAIPVIEGQQVKAGDLMFKVIPTLYQAKLDAEKAESQLAQLELKNANMPASRKISTTKKSALKSDVALLDAKAKKVEAKMNRDEAESTFAPVRAPSDGIVGRLNHHEGSLVKAGEELATLSDNSQMGVYFNVPKASYLEYTADLNQHQGDLQVELVLANGEKFEQRGKIGVIEAGFNNKQAGIVTDDTEVISFRAEFPNPQCLLRHGQTGNVLVHRVVYDAIVIPQQATFEILQKRYVYVVDKDNLAHQREIVIQNELEGLFVIKRGVGVDDKIVLEGIQLIRDGDKVDYEDRQPQQVVSN